MKQIFYLITLLFSVNLFAESFLLNCQGIAKDEFLTEFQYIGSINYLGKNNYKLGSGEVNITVSYDEDDNQYVWHSDAVNSKIEI